MLKVVALNSYVDTLGKQLKEKWEYFKQGQ